MKKEIMLPLGIVTTVIGVAFTVGQRVSKIETRLDVQDKQTQEIKTDIKDGMKEIVLELRKINEKVIILDATTQKIKRRVE